MSHLDYETSEIGGWQVDKWYGHVELDSRVGLETALVEIWLFDHQLPLVDGRRSELHDLVL